MNESDIDYAKPETNVLCRAASCLRDFKDLINAISDGWAYWSYGTKCSNALQELVQTPRCAQPSVTEAQVTAAIRKIAVFLRRCEQTKNEAEVLRYLEVWG